MADIEAVQRRIAEEAARRAIQKEAARRQGQPSERTQIGTFADNGRVYRRADGTLEAVSAGGATTDQDTVRRIMEGETFAQSFQRDNDEARIAANPVAARAQEFNQGAPFVGEWLDEAVGLVSPQAAQNMRATSDAMERQRPGQTMALNVAGGLAYAAPLAAEGIRQVANAPTRLGMAMRGAFGGAAVGAAEGASASAGRAEPGQRRRAAGEGAAVGGGLGFALGGIAPFVAEGVASLARRVKKLDVRTISQEFGLSPPAARIVRAALLNDDLDAAARVLARGGDDAMLGEAGPATRNVLDSAMQSGGAALRIGRDAVAERARGQATRFQSRLDSILGPGGGIRAATREASQRTAAARDKAYQVAYAQPTPMVGPQGEAIEGVLARISPRAMRPALEAAEDMMLDRGIPNRNIMASIRPDGTVDIRRPFSIAELDYIARGLSDVASKGTDPVTGKMTSTAALAARQARDLRDALRDGVPEFARAIKLGGDAVRESEAIRTGRMLLNPSTTVEDVRTMMQGASDEVRAGVRRGLRENIDAIMDRARTTVADFEAGNVDFDAGTNAMGEAVAALRQLTVPGNMRKVALALGKDAKPLMQEIERMADVMILRSAVARNSATAIRQATQGQIADEVAPGILRRTAGNMGNPLDAAQQVTRTIAGIDPRSMNDQQAAYLEEIARALTSIRGAEARRALIAVRQAMNGQPIREQEARLIGEVVSGAAAGGAYQGGQQALTQ